MLVKLSHLLRVCSFAFAFFSLTHGAFAQSPICNQVNGFQTSIGTVPGQSGTLFPSGFFQPGDYIRVTVTSVITGPGSVTFSSVTPPAAPVVLGNLTANVGSTIAFRVSSNAESVTFTNASGSPIGIDITIGCSAVPPNSNILEQVRQTFSKVAASTSAQAMGDATSGAIGDAFSGGGTTQLGQGGFSTSFAALEQMRDDDGDVKESRDPLAALAYKKSSVAYAKPFRKAPPRLQSPWHVWIDGRYTGFEDKSATNFDGWHSNITGGTSYRFTESFLAGVLVGYENFKYSLVAAGLPSSLDGSGVSGGGYFGWKFFDRMRLDGMLTYGRIDYNASTTGVSGSFGADRITGMTKLSGRYGLGSLWIEPSAMLTIANERQDSFIDSAATFHDKFSFTVGRSSNGATIGAPIALGMCIVTPTFGAFADYRFGDQTVAAANVVPTFNNGWSAHVNGGLNFALANGINASATGEYGGLGQDLTYWRAKGSVGVKF